MWFGKPLLLKNDLQKADGSVSRVCTKDQSLPVLDLQPAQSGPPRELLWCDVLTQALQPTQRAPSPRSSFLREPSKKVNIRVLLKYAVYLWRATGSRTCENNQQLLARNQKSPLKPGHNQLQAESKLACYRMLGR